MQYVVFSFLMIYSMKKNFNEAKQNTHSVLFASLHPSGLYTEIGGIHVQFWC